MATVTKAAPVAESTTAEPEAVEADNFDPKTGEVLDGPLSLNYEPKEVGRLLSVLGWKLKELARDSQRRTPIFSRSKEESIAKANSAMTVLIEFSDSLISGR